MARGRKAVRTAGTPEFLKRDNRPAWIKTLGQTSEFEQQQRQWKAVIKRWQNQNREMSRQGYSEGLLLAHEAIEGGYLSPEDAQRRFGADFAKINRRQKAIKQHGRIIGKTIGQQKTSAMQARRATLNLLRIFQRLVKEIRSGAKTISQAALILQAKWNSSHLGAKPSKVTLRRDLSAATKQHRRIRGRKKKI